MKNLKELEENEKMFFYLHIELRIETNVRTALKSRSP